MTTKKLFRNVMLLCLLVALSVANSFAATIIVNGNITTNTTWTNNNNYVLTGYIYVTNGATLTINKGTWISGDSITKGALIITRGSKLNAIGTACEPIVFTSSKPVGLRKRGDWGGLVLLGYAQTNAPGDTLHIEGITNVPETLFGGGKNPNCGGGICPNNTDNSGNLQYIRIEYTGIALAPNNEINGLMFGGVGSSTTVEHIQVSYANDDAYEWFGGTVNCKWLIAYSTIDDDFDTDNGYSGKVQFCLAMRDPAVGDISGSKAFETDNDPAASSSLPQTTVQFQNATAIGGASITTDPNFKQAANFKKNTNGKVYNSILMGFPQGSLVDGAGAIANCAASALMKGNYIHQATGNYRGFNPSGDPNQAAADANLIAANTYSTTYNGVLINPNFPIANVNDLLPAPGNPLPAPDASLYTGGYASTAVSYIGAFDPNGDNWAGDWTAFDPNSIVYTTKIKYTPTITSTKTDEICPNSGAIDVTVTGGIPPYSYLWSNGATTQDLTGLAKGTFTVTVYDAGKGCSVTSSKIKISKIKPLVTTCTKTNSTITVFWSNSLSGLVTGYQVRLKKSSDASYGSWISVGLALSYTATGLLSNTSYDFQVRGTCSSGNTGASDKFACSTTLREGDINNEGITSISTYPNPAAGEFTIEMNGFNAGTLVTITVSNTLGQVVYYLTNVSTDAPVVVSGSNFTNGIYNIEATDGVTRYTEKVIISQ